ncbi:hypothetical protein [uncultured Mediterranean phage]|nr:hypothetical protein [uncultured Mediterranean phage]
MVKYKPRGELPEIDDTTDDENYKLKRALDILFSMIQGGRNLYDISRVASKLAEEVGYPYLRKPATLKETYEILAEAEDASTIKKDYPSEEEE